MQSQSGLGWSLLQLTNGQRTALANAKESNSPLVAVTMGSDSGRLILAPGIDLLKGFGILFSVTIISAHRTPERMIQFAKKSASKGVNYH